MTPQQSPERESPGAGRVRCRGIIAGFLLAFACLSVVTPIRADEAVPATGEPSPWSIAGWSFQTSIYTYHFDPDPAHDNSQSLIGPELRFRNDWVAGLAVFDNSFGQTSEYAYMGKTWPLRGSPHWYVKLTGGLLHGYKEPYEDKIPFNQYGIAPAIVPSLGFRYRHLVLELHLGGIAVTTLTGGVRF
jgi:hypothetical protein